MIEDISSRAITPAQWLKSRRGAKRQKLDVLLDYQKSALACVVKNAVSIFVKSRRVGLTWTFAGDAVLRAGAQEGQDIFYMGYNHEMAREFISECAEWAKRYGEVIAEDEGSLWDLTDEAGDKSIQIFRIKFASGFKITALPSKPRALRGMQGVVIIDEAAFHEELDEVLKAALALLMWGGKVIILSTHNGADNPFARLVEDIRMGRRNYGLMQVDFDEALRDGLFQRICEINRKKYSLKAEADFRQNIIADYGEAADEELFCIPSKGTGAYLTSALIRACADDSVPVVRFQPPKGFLNETEETRMSTMDDWLNDSIMPVLGSFNPVLRSVFGFDFGRVADLSVLWVNQVLPNTNRACRLVVELRDVPFDCQKQILFTILPRLPRLSGGAMDAGGNGAHLAEQVAAHFGLSRILQIKMSQEFYRENTPKLKAAFEDKALSVPLDDMVIEDHRLFRMRNGVAQIPANQRVLDMAAKSKARRHGDAAIANLLAEHAFHATPHEYGYFAGDDNETSNGRIDQIFGAPEKLGDFGFERKTGI